MKSVSLQIWKSKWWPREGDSARAQEEGALGQGVERTW